MLERPPSPPNAAVFFFERPGPIMRPVIPPFTISLCKIAHLKRSVSRRSDVLWGARHAYHVTCPLAPPLSSSPNRSSRFGCRSPAIPGVEVPFVVWADATVGVAGMISLRGGGALVESLLTGRSASLSASRLAAISSPANAMGALGVEKPGTCSPLSEASLSRAALSLWAGDSFSFRKALFIPSNLIFSTTTIPLASSLIALRPMRSCMSCHPASSIATVCCV